MATLVSGLIHIDKVCHKKCPQKVVFDLASFGDSTQIEKILIMSHYPKKPSEDESLSHCWVLLQQCFANVKKTSKTKIKIFVCFQLFSTFLKNCNAKVNAISLFALAQ